MRRYYGFVPDGIRGALVFACMAGNSALLLLSRSLSFALLALIDPNYPLFYTLADVGLFFLQKIARNDLHVWLNVSGTKGIAADVFVNLMLKTVVDVRPHSTCTPPPLHPPTNLNPQYTGLIQARSYELMGGAYFTISLVCSTCVPFVVASAYFATTPASEVALDETDAMTLIGGLAGLWFALFALFLALIKTGCVLTEG